MSTADSFGSSDRPREQRNTWQSARLTAKLDVNHELIPRLFMGALSEHEQRRLVIAHLDSDAGFRLAVAESLRAFRVPDADAMARYAGALAEPEAENLDKVRAKLLAITRQLLPDVETLSEAFSYEDLLSLGPATQNLMSWTAAELFLEHARRPETHTIRKRVDLQLALTIIDVVEILGAAGVAPRYPEVDADVVRRIGLASLEVWDDERTDDDL